MQARDFCFWLQGFFELTGVTGGLEAAQAQMIRDHLNLVFQHDISKPSQPTKLVKEIDTKPQWITTRIAGQPNPIALC